MKVQILGSAAAEAIPALWCECDVCKQAKALGGKEIRRRTSYLLNDDTLIDFGPDIFSQFNDLANPLAIRRIFFTHSHQDHLNANDLGWRLSPYFSCVTQQLRIFGNDEVLRKIRAAQLLLSATARTEDYYLELIKVSPEVDFTDDDLTVWPVRANHAPTEVPLIYGMEQSGKRVLFANDTGMLSDASLAHLRNKRFDLAIIDSTCGKLDCRDHHLGVNNVVEFRDELLKHGALDDRSIVVANHFSHNGKMLHSDLEAFFGRHGILTGFDNMQLTLA